MSQNAVQAQDLAISIATGTGGAITVTAITKAYRAEVTGTHALTVGDRVTFASVGGMTQINTLVGTVIAISTTVSFVVDIDSRAFTTYTSGGTATPITYTEILDVKEISSSGATVAENDVTDLKSTAKEFMAGLPDNGTLTLNINYVPTDPGQTAVRAAHGSRLTKTYKVVDSDGTTYTFSAMVSSFPTTPGGATGGIITGSITLRLSGAVVVS